MPVKNRRDVPCDNCGKMLSKCPSLIHERNYCNMKCLGEHRKTHPTNDASQMHTPEARAKHKRSQELRDRSGSKNGMFGRKHSIESCDKMSETRTAMMLAGVYPTFGTRTKKGTYVSTKTGRSHFFRSGWEEAVMKYLDACDVVATWNYECVRIPYYYNNNKRWYVPDFIVTFWGGEADMWEVKPKKFVSTQKNELKESAAREWCKQNDISTYRVLTGDDLKAMGIL